MSWGCNEFFYENRSVSKGIFCFTYCPLHLVLKFFLTFYHAHAFSSASGRCFYEYGETYFSCYFFGVCYIGYSFICSRNHGNSIFLHGLFGGQFASHYTDSVRFWPNKNQPCLLYFFCKIGILTQKTITGMNSIGTLFFGYGNNLFAQKIRFIGRCRSD